MARLASEAGVRELSRKLDVVACLLSYQVRGIKDEVELMRMLSATGLNNTEIAPLVGKNAEAVKKALQRARGRAR